jgi:hypothetical protein
VRLDPTIAAAPIAKIAGLDVGRAAVITDRAIIGFTNLEGPPIFATDMGTYPYPLALNGGRDAWWLAVSSEREQKLIRVAPDGSMREIATLKEERVHSVMFDRGTVVLVCSGQGSSIHKRSFYVLDPSAHGALGRRFKLPDDTQATALWNGAIVSAAPGRRVLRTSIAP